MKKKFSDRERNAIGRNFLMVFQGQVRDDADVREREHVVPHYYKTVFILTDFLSEKRDQARRMLRAQARRLHVDWYRDRWASAFYRVRTYRAIPGSHGGSLSATISTIKTSSVRILRARRNFSFVSANGAEVLDDAS